MLSDDTVQRLKALRSQKEDAQRQFYAKAAQFSKELEGQDRAGSEDQHTSASLLLEDELDWTAQQWDDFDKQPVSKQSDGFMDYGDLAYSTYRKEIAKQPVDLEKYAAHQGRAEYDFLTTSNKEGAEAVARMLKEASDRKWDNRRQTASDDQYISEKNRQFNMKLNREYGE